MKCSDFIKENKEFQSSINIQYDLANVEKISSYIPSRDSVKVLKYYLSNMYYGTNNNSTLLVGPYGKGKSHLLLVLLSILCLKQNSTEVVSELIKKIEKIDNECAELAQKMYANKKYIPVIINFNSDDLNQAFLIAINNAINNAGIPEMLPNTYFDSALNIISGWKGYSATIRKFKASIKEKGINRLSEIEKRLKLFDKEAYEIFKYAFKEVTSGIEFNPLLNTDIVKMYEDINYNLKEKYDYDGMIIVFDEFSKFIESSAENNNIKDLKILQDIAELSNRAKNPQINLICVTHKTINEYISKIPENKIDAWRTIEGRFVEKYFTIDSSQNYELIASAIKKDEKKFTKFIEKNKQELEKLNSEAKESLFKEKTYEDYLKEIVFGCFPLNPYAVYALPIVSEKVAQNERTLFTYLSKNEPCSLIDYIRNNDANVKNVGLDSLYDYFKVLFQKESFNAQVHNIWLMVNDCLRIVNDEIDKAIVKTIGIIYIVNDFNKLAPTLHNLCDILNYDKKLIEEHLNNMINIDNILRIKNSNDFIDFMPISSVNVIQKVNDLVGIKFNKPNVSHVLNRIRGIKYELPRQYNFKYKMTRYFNRIFMTIDELTSYSNSEQILNEYGPDGVIIDLIYFENFENNVIDNWKKEINDDKIMINIPDKCFEDKNCVSQYEAVNYMYNDVELIKEDSRVISQLNLLKEDLQNTIEKYIYEYYEFNNKNCILYINKNKKIKSSKINQITTILSQICEDNFYNTPIINNELINKNKISAPVKKARDFIIQLILDNKFNEFDCERNALECTLFRATIKNTGILSNEINIDISNLLQIIRDFVIESEIKVMPFSELYYRLKSNKRGLGIRNGIIPIYLVIALQEFMDKVVIYFRQGRKKKEVVLDVNTINNINMDPEKYEIVIENGSAEINEYVNKMYELFAKDYTTSNISGKYNYIIRGMQNWYQSLSLFTKNHSLKIAMNEEYNKFTNIDDKIIKLRKNLVKHDINSREFLIDTIPSIFKVDNYQDAFKEIIEIKSYLDNRDIEVNNYLINASKDIICKSYNGTLSGALKSWYLLLNDNQRKHLYSSQCNNFMNMCNSDIKNDNEIINKLAFIFTNLTINDWNDYTYDVYFKELGKAIEEVEKLEEIKDISKCNNIIIKICNDNGTEQEKSFEKENMSVNGSLLLNEIENAIDEFNDSVDDNEKRNILLSLLERYM